MFLRRCLDNGVCPGGVENRVRRTKAYHTLNIERVFMKDEIARSCDTLSKSRSRFRYLYDHAGCFLSSHDFLRFSMLLSENDQKQRIHLITKHDKTYNWLRQKRCGHVTIDPDTTIINMTSLELTTLQKELLCRGTDFGIPPISNKKEVIMTEFELFYRKLLRFRPVSESQQSICAAKIRAEAEEHADALPDRRTFSLKREHLKALHELRNNKDIIVTRPDKGRATVLMNKTDYIEKMSVILNDTSKFRTLGPVKTCDRTEKVEKDLVTYLQMLKNEEQISKHEFDRIKPTGTLRPRLYGLPKIHKPTCPVRPIVSMTASPQYSISKWLCIYLQPVQDYYCKRTVKDSFDFVAKLRDSPVPLNAHMCSFDVVSLFTNVPIDETVDICMDVLYRNDDVDTPWVSEAAFRHLMLSVTTGVEFSFNDVMYKQVDGVAMGSPLGPVLANIFVVYCECKIDESLWPAFYVRFVDDSFTHFDSVESSELFLDVLNSLHPSLRFTCEHEQSSKLSFLDVLVEKTGCEILTSVYRKPTFTGQYIAFDSYCSSQYKVNLVRNLVDRAQRICSPSKLQAELDFLRSVFLKNGYPEFLLRKFLSIEQKPKSVLIGPPRCPVYLCLPWKGQESIKVCREVKSIVRRTYYAVHFVPVFTTMRAFTVRKDVLPTLHLSHVIYNFECRHCASRYVGRTVQHLNARIKQHTPLHILPPSAQSERPKRGRPRKNPSPTRQDSSLPLSAAPPLTSVLDGLELGSSLEVRAEPPLVQPSGVPKSVPLGALHGAVPRVVTAPLPPPDPPPSRYVLVESTRGGRFVPPELELDSTKSPTAMAATTTPASHPTTTPGSHSTTTTTTNPQNKAANDRPRRSTADYNRTYEFTVKIQRKQSERTTTDMKATAFTNGVGGEGETQDDASEEESRTAVDDGAGSDSDSEGEGELSEGESECEGVRVSRDCVRPSRNMSSVYNHFVSSTDCCRTYSDSCFSVLCRARHGYLLQLQVLEAVCQRIHKPNLCVQKDSVITLKLFK